MSIFKLPYSGGILNWLKPFPIECFLDQPMPLVFLVIIFTKICKKSHSPNFSVMDNLADNTSQGQIGPAS